MKKTGMVLSLVYLGVVAALAPARADDDSDAEHIVVISARAPRPIQDVAGMVSDIDDAFISENLVNSLGDLFRYEPGINVDNGGTRFGSTGIAIRGIGENRVAMLVDGIPVADQFDIGNYSNSGRDLMDLDLIHRVEVLHGPASALYGSDAVGGVVSFTTFDPADLLRRGNGDYFTNVRTGYDGKDTSQIASITGAYAYHNVSGLLSYAYREGAALDHSADSPRDDERDYRHDAGLAKFVWEGSRGNRLEFVAESSKKTSQSESNAIIGYGRFASTTALTGDDETTRQRVSLQWQNDLGRGNDYSVLTVYRQTVETRQLSDESRTVRNRPLQLIREFDYEYDVDGLNWQLAQSFDWGSLTNNMVYGIEWTRANIDEQRDGLQRDLQSGVVTTTVLGEELPVRDFPRSTIEERALYWNDEIALNERWLLLPALRYETYSLNVSADAVWQADNPTTPLVDVTEHALTPKLGAVLKVNGDDSVYLQWSEGFRSPPFEDANIGLYLPALHLRALPNPDLKPEESHGIELGWRRESSEAQWDIGLFYTEFDNFIETKVNLGVDPVSGDTLFQSQNINEARIYGMEWQSLTQLAKTSVGEFTLRSALYYGKGENRSNDEPLNTVAPANGTLGLIWLTRNENVSVQFCTRFADNKKHVDETKTEVFKTPGYAVFDVSADWHITTHWQLTTGIYNATDKTWWQWTDIKQLESTHPAIPLLSQPGRYISATLRWTY